MGSTKQDTVTIKYPLAKYAKTLTKESYAQFVYDNADKAFIVLRALGSSWAKNKQEVENTVFDLVESALKEIRNGKKSANVASGMLRVELTISPDWEDDYKTEVVYPQLVLEF